MPLLRPLLARLPDRLLLQQPPQHAARGRGQRRLTLVTNAVVSHVTTDDEGKCTGVYYVDRVTRNHRAVSGKLVVLCASTLESTRIMPNSTSSRHPAGLANSSGVLGHYLMDHVCRACRGRPAGPRRGG